MTLAVMSRGPRSCAREMFQAASAALAAPYESAPRSAATELNEITAPPGASRSVRAVVSSTAVSTFAAKFRSHRRLTSVSVVGAGSPMVMLPPAQLTRTSTGVGRSSMTPSIARGSARSAGTAWAPIASAASCRTSGRRPMMVTSSPRLRRLLAIARPIPVPPPVTMTIRVMRAPPIRSFRSK